MKTVDKFLKRFHESRDVDEVFTCGCCYWFALVLSIRFAAQSPVIMYDSVANHFGTDIDGRVYDITGDVTDVYRWVRWSEIDKPLKDIIKRDCIMF